MVRLASIIILLQVGVAHASVESDNADAPESPRPVVKPEPPPDPYGRSPLRVDAQLGIAMGDVYAFAMRAHVGYSRWWVSSHDLVGDSGWHAGLRLTGGAALGADFRTSNAYGTLAPYAELGLVFVKERDELDDPKHVLLFTRVEPRLFGGELGERGARIGVGFTLDGFEAVGLGFDHEGKDEVGDFTKIALLPAAIAMLAVVNARDVEVATDVGADGRREYALMLGFGI